MLGERAERAARMPGAEAPSCIRAPTRACDHAEELGRLSLCMRSIGGMQPAFRGLSLHSVMSPEVQLALFFRLEAATGRCCLLATEGPFVRVHGRGVCGSSVRMLIWVDRRHWICARRVGGVNCLLDTVRHEDRHCRERSDEVLELLRPYDWPGCPPGERGWVHDEGTPQQTRGRGGCTVMSFCNHVLPDGEYATVEDGEAMRCTLGAEVCTELASGVQGLPDVDAFMRGCTPCTPGQPIGLFGTA